MASNITIDPPKPRETPCNPQCIHPVCLAAKRNARKASTRNEGRGRCAACGLTNASHGESGLCREAIDALRERLETAEDVRDALGGEEDTYPPQIDMLRRKLERAEALFRAACEQANRLDLAWVDRATAMREHAERVEAERDAATARAERAEAERDMLGAEAVDRLMLVATLRTRAEKTEAERDAAFALLRECADRIGPVSDLHTRIFALIAPEPAGCPSSRHDREHDE